MSTHNQKKGLKRKVLDKFYTKPTVVNFCIKKVSKFIQIHKKDLILEPSGGEGAFLEVLTLTTRKKIEIKNKIYAYDQNKDLITVYRNIQTNHECLFEKLTLYFSQYHKLTTPCLKKEFYYKIRDKFNTMDKNTVDCSAIFIFLNKTCFRGLFRVNKNNKFNVPYGHYRNTPSGPSKTELDRLSNLIKNVIFMDSNFEKSFQQIIPQDFVYLDPPYWDCEKDYGKDLFSKADFKRLAKTLRGIKGKFLLSLNDTVEIREIFKAFDFEVVQTTYSISKGKNTPAKEVIISN